MHGGYQQHGVYQNGSPALHHYSHAYAPLGEPSQPLRPPSHGSGATGTLRSESSLGRNDSTSSYDEATTYQRQPHYETTYDSGPIPAPVVKAAYAAPVFQTFQDRRRAKELALSAQMGHPSRDTFRQTGLPPTPSPQHFEQPAMPVRSSASSPHVPAQPTHTAQAPARPAIVIPPPPVNDIERAGTPDSKQPLARPTTSRPLPNPIKTEHSPPEPGPSTPRSATVPSVLDRSDTISSVKSLDRGMGFGSPTKRPLPKPPVGVNTSKSLDRGIPSGIGGIGLPTILGPAEGYKKGSGRKLPSTVTEISEGSEDGIPTDLGGTPLTRSPSPTKASASPVKREPVRDLPIHPQGPSIPTIVEPPGLPTPTFSVEPPSAGPQVQGGPTIIEPPTIVEPESSLPATYTPLPAITIGDGEEDKMDTANGGIVFGGLPTIAVSSSDTTGGISISVPGIQGNNVVNAPTKPISSSAPTRIDPTSAIICVGCSNPIIGRIVSAMDERWHPHCFMCGECGELLEHVSSYEFNGKPYCHLDYHDVSQCPADMAYLADEQKFAHRCHHCKTPIVEPRFITLDDPVLGQRYYHELHFFCSECGDPFLDPSKSSAPGTERSRPHQPEEEETNAFVIQKGHPYCERCHLRLHKPRCKGCRLPIPDVAVDALNGKWHSECFVCAECSNGFANNLFFPQDGKAFCTECYSVMIGN